jgi:DNA-binding phage protein
MDIVDQLNDALGTALKSRSVHSIAKDSGLKPELLYRLVRGKRSLRLATVGSFAKLAKALGLKLVPSSEAPTMNDLVVGKTYSRKQISEVVGGGYQSYLPTVNGRVVCGCFWATPEVNRDAPERVSFGGSPEALPKAKIIARQPEPIPIFLAHDEYGVWKYMGRYRCTGLSFDPVEIKQEMAANPERPVVGFICFERVSD